MNFVTDTFHQLVRRRLWPVALLLLAALVAVPVLLAKEPEPSVAPTVPAASANADTTLAEDTEAIVSIAAGGEAQRRRVLGARKDPFEPAPAKKVKAVKETAAAVTDPGFVEPTTPSGSTGGPTGGSTPPDSGTPGTPVSPTPVPAEPEAPPKPEFPLYTLTVRFGDTSSDTLPSSKVTRLEALPSADEPALVYLGVKEGGKAAVFMLDSSVVAQGDGKCDPSPDECETLTMREGDTEFFDVTDGSSGTGLQFQLDLVDIKTRRIASDANAKKASARHSKAGRKAVRAHTAVGGPLRYRYNARKGTLEQLGLKAWKAASASASAIARAGL